VRLIASLVLDGHGAGIVPYTTLPSNLALARVITIRDLPKRQVGVVRRQGVQLSTPSHVVLDILQEVLRTGPAVPGVHLHGTGAPVAS
jgi:DNA-binding transcriptional LysR family regulator